MRQVKAVRNQYLGINAHLHSYWQANGDWSEIHLSYIVQLSRAFKAQLLPLGYTTGIEKSLQIRRYAETVYGEVSEPTGCGIPVGYMGDSHQITLALNDVLLQEDDIAEKPYRALGLYTTQAKQNHEQPFGWVELLTPTNKPGGRDAESYRKKRRNLLERGLLLIEIDYLHESSPAFHGIPDYRTGSTRRQAEIGSHAYRIVVVDPRPQFDQGKVQVYQFDVDAPLPTVTIPLQDHDKIDFNFGIPYHEAVQMELFTVEFVDYSRLPQHFERYSLADQQCIVARMLAVLEAANQGIDLETGPFPTQSISLEEALIRIEAFQQV
jgi:hypothetical protein